MPNSGNLHKSLYGPRRLKRGHTQVFGYVQVVGSPSGATHRRSTVPRRLDPQPRLHAAMILVLGFPSAATDTWGDSQPRLYTGVWIPNWVCIHAFGPPTENSLQTGVWILNRGCTGAFGFPTRDTCGRLESQNGDPASCQLHLYRQQTSSCCWAMHGFHKDPQSIRRLQELMRVALSACPLVE